MGTVARLWEPAAVLILLCKNMVANNIFVIVQLTRTFIKQKKRMSNT
jgi:hypothetical protein